MGKTRKGIDRLTKQDLQARKRGHLLFIRDHVHNCSQCTNAGLDPFRKCKVWWSEAKALHKVDRQLHGYDMPDTAGMDTLPGMG